ncbi:NAD-dependent protein deacylase, partial [Geodia barretti]
RRRRVCRRPDRSRPHRVESGIPSFSLGPDGLWTKYGQPSNLSYGVFSRDPQDWWEQRLSDEDAVDNAEPNPGHVAIAQLEDAGIIRAVITQNVDDLHGRAGSLHLLEIHGNRNYLRCIGCGWRRPRAEHAITDVPPVCVECGGIIKLDTVMFGEPIPRAVLDACFAETQRCDAMLLVGTSGAVNPAAQLPLLARERGASIIEVNPEPTQLTAAAHVVVTGPSGDMLPRIVQALRSGEYRSN